MSFNYGNVGGLLGAVVGFVVLSEGIKLVRSSQREAYRKKGYKIHPIKHLKKYKASNKIGNIKIPKVRIRI